jgi:regulator of nucleoside diphosphate kinase
MMDKAMFITIRDHERIMGLITSIATKTKLADSVDRLLTNLKKARVLPPENISGDIITMNSRACLKEIVSGRKIEITVTYPQDANTTANKVSVFSTIGIALLGSRAGDIVSWKIPTGIGQFKIEKVIYQPEAVGHYHL